MCLQADKQNLFNQVSRTSHTYTPCCIGSCKHWAGGGAAAPHWLNSLQEGQIDPSTAWESVAIQLESSMVPYLQAHGYTFVDTGTCYTLDHRMMPAVAVFAASPPSNSLQAFLFACTHCVHVCATAGGVRGGGAGTPCDGCCCCFCCLVSVCIHIDHRRLFNSTGTCESRATTTCIPGTKRCLCLQVLPISMHSRHE